MTLTLFIMKTYKLVKLNVCRFLDKFDELVKITLISQFSSYFDAKLERQLTSKK